MKGAMRTQVSVRGATYERLAVAARERGVRISNLVELVVEAALAQADGRRAARAVDPTASEG